MACREDRALFEAVRQEQRAGFIVVYIPSRDHDIREFKEVVGRDFDNERRRRGCNA